jgi:uncharacterized membrane protein
MNATRDRLVDDYLARLNAALADLPAERRREIVAEVAEHIDAARAEIAPDDEAALRTLLDRVGDPEQIADDARGEVVAPRRRGMLENVTIGLLLIGGFLGGIGWLVGVVLLWLSDKWRVRDKVIGTVFVPGGLALPFLLFAVAGVSTGSGTACIEPAATANHCMTTGGASLWQEIAYGVGLVTLAAASIAAAVHLARRSR